MEIIIMGIIAFACLFLIGSVSGDSND